MFFQVDIYSGFVLCECKGDKGVWLFIHALVNATTYSQSWESYFTKAIYYILLVTFMKK